MQDQYAGDIGDFGKYGLLRAICRDLALGVVWYLTPPEQDKPSDGKHVEYLRPTIQNANMYKDLDEALYQALDQMVCENRRSVAAIKESGVLPDASFYEEMLTFNGMPGRGRTAIEGRLALRKSWVDGALDATSGRDLVFVDPDNGLEVGSTRRHHKRGPKYVFLDELARFVRREQSLVIYQHANRQGSLLGDQVPQRFHDLTAHLAAARIFALVWHPVSKRAFFIVPAAAHSEILLERAKRFVRGAWGQHFELVEHGSRRTD